MRCVTLDERLAPAYGPPGDAKDLQANAVKVVTERGIVYLMGRVTSREAKRATDIVRGMGGVVKVVRVFDEISEEELKRLSQPTTSR